MPDYHDEHADKIAHIPYTPLAFTTFGTALARKLHAPNNAARKLIVLDGDGTLWDGVCGEDGPTAEAGSRTAAYRHEAHREQLRQASPTLEDFIAGLELRCELAPLTETDIPRVAELTQRTNQFNLTTRRRSEAELQALCLAGQAECLVVRVSDRLGDYGLVGALIFHARIEALVVESFLLSCRALGRGVEYRMLAALGDIARQRGLERAELDFVPTQKNTPAREFLNAVSADFANDCSDPDIDAAG